MHNFVCLISIDSINQWSQVERIIFLLFNWQLAKIALENKWKYIVVTNQ